MIKHPLTSINYNLITLTPHLTRFLSLSFVPLSAMSSSPAVSVVAEYAKSGRSSCKKCLKAITAGALRLGLVNKGPQGFDMTKWHHLDCVPLDASGPVPSPDAITGFSSLKSCDQEAVNKLLSEASEKVSKMDEEDEKTDQVKSKKKKASKTDEEEDDKPDQAKSKKQKPEITDTTSDIKDTYKIIKVVAEYAKSGRSSCKKCSKAITAGALRFGLVSKGPQGFDMTKWHHLDCVTFGSSGPVSSADAITGFSSLKSCDQEAVNKLLSEGDQASEKVSKMDEEDDKPDKGKSKKKASKTDGEEDEKPDQGKSKKQKLITFEEATKPQLEITVSASDIKDKYKDATLLPKWKAFQTVIFLERDDGLHDSSKIAAFDFDGCLANTSVRRVGANAWSLMYPSIPEMLQNLYRDGYKLVIFTNESNIERWKNKRQAAVDSKIGRLENFIKRVKVPIQVFIACGLGTGEPEDMFRKPKPGMWKIMEKEFNSGLPVDMDKSFYVGDAAGRPDDHSDADIKFAQAVGLKFYVPEEYFCSD